jgi:hypothetical protein
MFWENVLADRQLTPSEVAAALDRVFGLAHHEKSLVIRDVTEDDVPPHTRVFAELIPVGGSFPSQLNVYLADEQLEPTDRVATVGQLCEMLQSSCLMPSASSNPYEMLLIEPHGAVRPVHVDVDRLDNSGEYVIRAEPDGDGLLHQATMDGDGAPPTVSGPS